MTPFETRREKLRKALAKADLDALLITSFANVTYLTGFTGDDSYLLLSAGQEAILTDPRYSTQLDEECAGLERLVRPPGTPIWQAAVKAIHDQRLDRVGIEGDSMPVALRDKLAEKLPGVQFQTTAGLVEQFRQIKDKGEIEAIRQAIWYAERAFAVARSAVVPEWTELQLANRLEFQMREFGARGTSFPTIVAVGPRAALPHGRPSEKRIGESEFTLVDWGATGKLYKSDLTRLIVTGRIPPKLERIYRVVLQAQREAIAAIRPGARACDVDAVAREVIAEAGFGRNFGHSLGHGIGLEIHEGPRLAKTNQEPLRPGMVVTVEPGIYLPGWGGVRIEDDVLVTKTGHEVLTSVAKDLEAAVVC
jgi:Xaa-Pro aminopeptidase